MSHPFIHPTTTISINTVPVAHISFVYAGFMAISFYTHAASVQVSQGCKPFDCKIAPRFTFRAI